MSTSRRSPSRKSSLKRTKAATPKAAANRKKTAAKKSTATRQATTKKAATNRKKTAAKKSTATRKAATKKAATKKATAKKGATKKGATKKAATKKGATKKAATKKGATKKAATKKAATKKAATKKAATKKAATKKAATKKATAKKGATKKAATKKAAAKKAATKKATAKKAATKKAATKKAATKKATAKKAATKKAATKKAATKKAATKRKTSTRKKQRGARPGAATKTKTQIGRKTAQPASPSRAGHGDVPPTSAVDAPLSEAIMPTTPSAPSSKKRSVIRRPAGEKGRAPPDGAAEEKPKVIRMAAGEREQRKAQKAAAGILELNPRLESSRGRLPKAEGQVPGGKPMSFAERQLAEAEAAFQKIAPKWAHKVADAPAPEPEGPPRTQFEIRVNRQDSLTTELRLSEGKKAFEAAQTLAKDYRLPPDQALLMKVIDMGDTELTRLALEELLELDDRGRIRSTPQLIEALRGIESRDREIKELRELFLEKLGAA